MGLKSTSKIWIFLLLGSCLMLMGTANAQSPLGNVDSATIAGGVLSVNGWAVIPSDTPPAPAVVQVVIDGRAVTGNLITGLSRPDVASYFGNSAYTNSGWSFSCNVVSCLAGFSAGGHTVSEVVSGTVSGTATLGAAGFTMVGPLGNVDSVIISAGTLTATGWATSPDDNVPAMQVKALIDGKAVSGTVTLGVSRPDVTTWMQANGYPSYTATNSGWKFTCGTASCLTALTAGSHTFSITAYDKENLTSTFNATINIAPPLGTLESAVGSSSGTATVAQSENLTIKGWAADPQDGAPVKQIQILIDGTAVGNVTVTGISRPDVVTFYSNQTYLKSGWSYSYSLAKLVGPHTVTAIATDNEGLSTPLIVMQNTFTVLAPDLTEAVTIPPTAVSGGSLAITDTTTNAGNGSAGTSWTRFYLNVKGGTLLGTRTISTLAAGANSQATTTVTLPLNLNGQISVVACANDTGSLVESNTTNNCATATTTVAAADLSESGVSVTGSLTSGGSISVSDTVTNAANAGLAGTSWTRFYLNTTPVKGGTSLTTRTVPALAPGASSSGTTTLSLPLNLSGQYFVVACANDTGSVTEGNTTNNCAASSTAMQAVAADLMVSAVSTNPAAVVPGGTLAVTDTTANGPAAPASSSYTRYYLSKTATLVKTGTGAGILLGSRSVPALAVSGTSTGAAVNVSVAPTTTAGNYFVIACANDTGSVTESNYANNCIATPAVVYTVANSVFVDQANANASDTNCGTSAIPCKTITEGLAAAKPGTTVLVNTGTYTEQINITQNVTLASTLKNTAIVQAPAVLVPDPELANNGGSPGQQTVSVNISGGATSVSVVNMGVRGPGPSSCGSIGYGIYVANANATIVGNQVLSIRDNPYSGCQNGIGIRFGSLALGFVGHTGTIAYNTFNDYNKAGIVVDGTGTNVAIVGNTVTGQNTTGINGQNGIQISRGAIGTIDSNKVSNNRYANTPLTQSAAGILVYDIVGGVTITNNIVTGNDEGIGVYSDSPAATNVTIKNNTSNANAALGIHIDANSTGNTIWLNTVQNNGVYEEADEHADWNESNWGTDPSNYNILGPSGVHAGPFTF